jgi:hypothetical protein
VAPSEEVPGELIIRVIPRSLARSAANGKVLGRARHCLDGAEALTREPQRRTHPRQNSLGIWGP